MTDAGWAEKKVYRLWGKQSLCWSLVAKLLKAEHARSVRIVKEHIKQVQLDQYTYIDEQTRDTVIARLHKVVTALQRGRGGKG